MCERMTIRWCCRPSDWWSFLVNNGSWDADKQEFKVNTETDNYLNFTNNYIITIIVILNEICRKIPKGFLSNHFCHYIRNITTKSPDKGMFHLAP